MTQNFVLLKIAELLKNEEVPMANTVKKNDKVWRLRIEKNAYFDIISLLPFESSNANFSVEEIKEEINDGTAYLAIIFRASKIEKRSKGLASMILWNKLAKKIFHNCHTDFDFDQKHFEHYPHVVWDKYVTASLYNTLSNEHRLQEEGESSSPLVLPNFFQPTLCRFQDNTVRWLLKREKELMIFKIPYVKFDCLDMTTIYKHPFYLHFEIDIKEEAIELPPGGILADEMGLGKTVELLALIVLHPRIDIKTPKINYTIDEIPAKRLKIDKVILCICGSKKVENVVECTYCKFWQHMHCVTTHNEHHSKELNEPYICPSCWFDLTKTNSPIESRATLIITPATIRNQWLSEIYRHTDPQLSVLCYEGAVQGSWISPRQLADYDIVLTDYNVLRRDHYHTTEYDSKRVLRNEKRSLRVHTPLLMVNWWRVCLDEAQMVESNVSKIASLTRYIPAVNRWAVSGTPIQRSIDDLQGLLHFIKFHDINKISRMWYHLVNEFVSRPNMPKSNNRSVLVSMLQKCMWRTSKSSVSKELEIPPQTEKLHNIRLSNLERLYYAEQHEMCADSFNETLTNCFERMDEGSLSLSPKVMKLVLQPLLNIRQICNIPTIQNRVNDKFVQFNELHTHLKSTNEIECKTLLRHCASAYNAIAASYFARNQYADAIKNYECVLKLARDYSDYSENLCVDSLLQIHALQNILQAIKCGKNDPFIIQYNEKCTLYEEQLNTLEWKYLLSYAKQLANAKSSFHASQQKYQDLNSEMEASFSSFIAETLQLIIEGEGSQTQESLMNKILDECLSMFPNSDSLHHITSLNGVLFTIQVWYTKVEKKLKILIFEFESLKMFTENIHPRKELSDDVWGEVKNFVDSVYSCHLKGIRENPAEKKESIANKDTNLCKLCIMKKTLNEFECLLFNKVIDENTNQTDGVASHAMEILMIKLIFNFAKNKNMVASTQTFEKHWESIEYLQTLYDKFIKYWIEIEYTAKAYDELDMCKTRITVTNDPKEISNFKILASNLIGFCRYNEEILQEAQRNFAMKFSRLKYINHLETNDDPGVCPICRTGDQLKYAVLECGHHICCPCLKALLLHRTSLKIVCSLCRNEQFSKKIYYVSRVKKKVANETDNATVFSSKIDYIVNLVLQLLQNNTDCKVGSPKILIFSQWEAIVNTIYNALHVNNVTCRILSNPRSLADFKDQKLGITCLLMPLAKGSKGLNLIEATHVFLVEPILNLGDELQAIGRLHRIGQTKPTTVHRFVVENTVEENIYNAVTAGKKTCEQWEFENIAVDSLRNLFKLRNDVSEDFVDECVS